MTTLAVVLARGGSKGIPRKNVRPLAGRPLVAWTIDAALQAPGVDRVVVSTDDEEIADVARRAGADVPFLRPAALAGDESPAVDAVLHALDALPGFDEVVMLQPTSPLRTAADVAGCVALARARGAPRAVSVTRPRTHPYWTYRLSAAQTLEPFIAAAPVTRRQDLPDAYALNGAVYYARAERLRAERGFVGPDTVGYEMPAERSVDIDSPLDWHLAELLLGARA